MVKSSNLGTKSLKVRAQNSTATGGCPEKTDIRQ